MPRSEESCPAKEVSVVPWLLPFNGFDWRQQPLMVGVPHVTAVLRHIALCVKRQESIVLLGKRHDWK
jgi:hypothetical protein